MELFFASVARQSSLAQKLSKWDPMCTSFKQLLLARVALT
jgi:hypothetical protein